MEENSALNDRLLDLCKEQARSFLDVIEYYNYGMQPETSSLRVFLGRLNASGLLTTSSQPTVYKGGGKHAPEEPQEYTHRFQRAYVVGLMRVSHYELVNKEINNRPTSSIHVVQNKGTVCRSMSADTEDESDLVCVFMEKRPMEQGDWTGWHWKGFYSQHYDITEQDLENLQLVMFVDKSEIGESHDPDRFWNELNYILQ
jgi:hypothetical protein